MVSTMLSIQETLPGVVPTPTPPANGYRPTGPGRGRFKPTAEGKDHFSMPDALIDERYTAKIGALGLALYAALRKHADAEGYCWPKHETLGRLSGMSKASVKRTLKVLRQHHLITWEPYHDPEGDPDANTYRLLPVEGWGHTEPRGGVTQSLGVGSHRPQGGVRVSRRRNASREVPSLKGGKRGAPGGAHNSAGPADTSHSPPVHEGVHTTAEAQATTQGPASTPVEDPPGWETSTLPGRAEEVWQGWQAICAPAGLPPATWTPDLQRLIVTALKKYPAFELWEQALNTMAGAPYFRSRKAQGWENTLHWLVKGDHAHQVVNGVYACRQIG